MRRVACRFQPSSEGDMPESRPRDLHVDTTDHVLRQVYFELSLSLERHS